MRQVREGEFPPFPFFSERRKGNDDGKEMTGKEKKRGRRKK